MDHTRQIEALFREHYPALVLYAVRFLGERENAKEVVQEMFIALFERKKMLVFKVSAKAYLFQGVKNRCLNQLKKMKTEESKRELYRQEREEEVSFSNPLEAAEFEHKLFQIIAKLPPASRSVFRMSRFDGKSNQEIAQELNISKRTVETHISNALKFLRKALFGQQGAGAVQRALLSFLV